MADRYPNVNYSDPEAPKRGQELEVQPTEVPLGLVLIRNMWVATKGTLTLDLKRPTIPRKVAARRSLFTFRKEQEAAAAHSAPPTRPSAPQFASSRAAPRPYAGEALPVVPFSDTGARLKLMRHVHLGPEFEGMQGTGNKKVYPAVDIGLGLNFELDTAEVQPQARVKLWDFVSVRALPRPAVKLSKRLPLGTTDFGVRLSFDCPLDNVGRFWEPPSRLMVSVDNLSNNGLRLTQTGVDFDGNVSFAEGSLMIRGSGHVDFPQQLPVEEGEPLVRYELRRLGLKANW